jgi:hypothetical protein
MASFHVVVSFFFLDSITINEGRGTLVDLTSTLTMPLLARDRCNGTVDMEQFSMETSDDVRDVHRWKDRGIMMREKKQALERKIIKEAIAIETILSQCYRSIVCIAWPLRCINDRIKPSWFFEK